MSTNEFECGFESMALHFGMEKFTAGNGHIYHLPAELGTGWIHQIHAAPGLFCTSVWFTSARPLSYTIHVEKPCIWLFSISCGDMILTRRGKAAQHLSPKNEIFINPRKPFTISFPANSLICFTGVLLFEEYAQKQFAGKLESYNGNSTFQMEDIRSWTPQEMNTPDITLVLDEIKWAVRQSTLPLFYYECKIGELMMMLYRNAKHKWLTNKNRAYHVTWENEQILFKVKQLIDRDILSAPSLKELAAAAGMSISKLSRCFKELYCTTLSDYIRTEKLKKAMHMMASDELAIKDIASACGYECASRFTAAFKSVHHMTPREYRKAFNL